MATEYIKVWSTDGYKEYLQLHPDKETTLAFMTGPTGVSGTPAIVTGQEELIKGLPDSTLNPAILTSNAGQIQWTDFSELLDLVTYGVSWKPNVADPELTRVGNPLYHETLPIQSAMGGVLYNPKEKRKIAELNYSDWQVATSMEEYYTIHDKTSSVAFGNITVTIEKKGLNFNSNRIIFGGSVEDNPSFAGLPFSGSDIVYDNGSLVIHFSGATINYGTLLSFHNVYYQLSPGRLVELDSVLIGNSTITISRNQRPSLSGMDGEVMVYVPGFYIKSWDTKDRREVRISQFRIDDTWEYQPPMYVGAYKDTILNTVPENMGYLSTLEEGSAVCVANSNNYCRGGDGTNTNDADEDVFKRNLGKPRTNMTRAAFREAVRKSGKEILSYKQYKNLYWLYVIEYANFNSQATFNEELTDEGYSQGGLGDGITNVPDWNTWSVYNNNNPICPCGYTNDIGNRTGIKLIEPNGPAPVGSIYANRWRGIENPFGDIWTNVDGIIIDSDQTAHPGINKVYTTTDPSKYEDTMEDIANMTLTGEEIYDNGYIKEFGLGSTAEIIPRLNGGNATEYKCDYHYSISNEPNPRTLLLGGHAPDGSLAGLGGFYSGAGVGYSFACVGFRSVCVIE